MKRIKTIMGNLPSQVDNGLPNDWFFTIGRGKAKYHIWALADNSCGIYYCYRIDENGYAIAKRAVEPDKVVTIHYMHEK